MKTEIRNRLFELRDLEYRNFTAKLVPNIDRDRIIGIRTPDVRILAKAVYKNENIGEFLCALPHGYLEENAIHSFIICEIGDYDECIKALDSFLPYVDNWATCDSIKPKCFKKNTDRLLKEIKRWLLSEHTYTVRFGILMLMTHFLDSRFDIEYLEWVAAVKSQEYYINMMIAWYFATALAKQYESTLPYITQSRLDIWIHNKTIQKAIESYRITDEQKTLLKGLKRKP